jgi:hypothetical protein
MKREAIFASSSSNEYEIVLRFAPNFKSEPESLRTNQKLTNYSVGSFQSFYFKSDFNHVADC